MFSDLVKDNSTTLLRGGNSKPQTGVSCPIERVYMFSHNLKLKIKESNNVINLAIETNNQIKEK